ncbi:MAG: hypothetical protein IJ406_06500 [Oscillospiraceae bacterium]|nr:hypothetical protein [Oscillospiraceae bacterium]
MGAVAAVGAFFVGYWLFAVTVIGVCFGIMILLSNKSEIKQLEQNCSEKIRTTSKVLQDLFTEFSNYTKEYEEYDSYYDRIKNEFNKI